jgi:hypothetical protein
MKDIIRTNQLAGIITEGQVRKMMEILNEEENNEYSFKNLIKQWINDNTGGYGPDKDDPQYFKFKKEMDILLNNTLEDFNPDYYGDDTTMSPDEILEDFIEEAINIISKYTMGYYGDDTSFSPRDIKDDFYVFVKR